MDCDILVLAPHPDDAEISCGGAIAHHVDRGARVVVVDATAGEMGTRGTPEDRAREAAAGAQVLGLAGRECLGLPDGHLNAGDTTQRNAIVDAIRRYRPPCLLSIAGTVRHPDHLALHGLVASAVKAAALHKLATPSGAAAHAAVRHWLYEAELPVIPDFLVPVSAAAWGRKMDSIRCYGSQLHNPESGEPETSISQPDFLDWIEDRGRLWGRHAGAPYAEGFLKGTVPPRIQDLREI